jgi:hypothetical protein
LRTWTLQNLQIPPIKMVFFVAFRRVDIQHRPRCPGDSRLPPPLPPLYTAPSVTLVASAKKGRPVVRQFTTCKRYAITSPTPTFGSTMSFSGPLWLRLDTHHVARCDAGGTSTAPHQLQSLGNFIHSRARNPFESGILKVIAILGSQDRRSNPVLR